MNVSYSGFTTVGRRSNNEDSLCLAPELGLFLVADGLGGYDGGEVASSLVASVMRDFIEHNRRDPQGTWPIREDRARSFEENLLAAAAVVAHREIAARRTGVLRQMGSTVVAALLVGERLVVGHVGDSRLYRLREGVLAQLTRDHSLWAEMSAAGLAQDRASFAYKNQITRALGLDGDSTVDVACVDAKVGDTYLLCSDGLYDPLTDQQLAAGLTAEPGFACRSLVQTAYDAGSTDNITSIVLRLS